MIKAGWFDVQISNELKTFELTNSWYLGNDAPKILLRNFNELCSINDTRWLCWHDEPGAYIWKLSKHKDMVTYEISSAMRDSYAISCVKESNQLGNFEGEELKLEEKYALELEGETNFFDAFASIVKAFEKYSFGDKLIVYQREWRDFPFNEFQLACNLLCSK